MNVTVNSVRIDAGGLHYRELNQRLRAAVTGGANRIELENVAGQRYIGTNLHGAASPDDLARLEIEITGTPGNDLGAFLDGPTITVRGNVMDGAGNTMNRGRIVAHGRAGDITGFSARGGEIFIKGNAGYRAGIHMKEFESMRPVMVIGGTAQDFLGEYMAGGVVIVLGLTLKQGESHYASHVGTGMHGGVIYIRGEIGEAQVSEAVGISDVPGEESAMLCSYVYEYARLFNTEVSDISPEEFVRLTPRTARPYQQLYAY